MKHIVKFITLIIVSTSFIEATAQEASPISISDDSFKCIRDMTPVRGFYVDNLSGSLEGTLAAANTAGGAVYPVGSVVQLIPTEVMVKREVGFNAVTKDWEFFELDVDGGKSVIRARGVDDVKNRFGGNCFDCHVKARAEFDLVCETGHGCDPIPLTPVMVKAIQKTDPRCGTSEELTPEEVEILKLIKSFTSPQPAGS